MTDDFEESLRETLGKAVPDVPAEPDRATAARGYARRIRRTRALGAVGAVAAVVAAVVVVPSVLASTGSNVANPGVTTPATGLPPQGGPACPSAGQTVKATDIASVAGNAVAARLCVWARAGQVWTPREPLVTGLADLAQKLNALPQATIHRCLPAGSIPRYQLILEYAGGKQVVVTGDLGCGYVGIGASYREGADDILQSYLGRIADQRQTYAPPASTAPAPPCTQGLSAVPGGHFVVDGHALSLRVAQVCVVSNFVSGQETQVGLLSPAAITLLNSDFAAHRSRIGPMGPRVNDCFAIRGGGIPTYEISGINIWGDPVRLTGTCEVFSYTDRSGRWYWVPSPALSAMLESALHPAGQLTGLLRVVGGPYPGFLRPMPGRITVRGSGGTHQVTAGPDGRFTFDLTPGRYRIVGHSPLFNDGTTACQPVHPFITVREGQTVHVSVFCQEN